MLRGIILAGGLLLAGLFSPAAMARDNAGVRAFLGDRHVATIDTSAQHVDGPGKPRQITPARAGMADVVLAAARRHGVPEALAYGVASVESRFDPRAHSHAGAVGLMQVMPATARGLGCGAALFNPAVNADCGARYLARLLARTGGNQRAAAALYNVGEFGNPKAGSRYAALVMERARRILS